MKTLVAIRSDRQAACATWTAVSHYGMRVLAGAGGRRGRQPRDGWGRWHARRRPNQRWNVGGAAASEHFQASGVRITARREVGCRHDGAPQLELLAAREDVALVAG